MAARRQGQVAIYELHVELEDFQPVALRAAELAARSLSDPQDQSRFVAKVRELLADDIQRGEPMTPLCGCASARVDSPGTCCCLNVPGRLLRSRGEPDSTGGPAAHIQGSCASTPSLPSPR